MNINRRIIICPWHWPPAYLRSWTEFNFAGKPAVVGDKNILCEHHLRMQSTPVGRFDLYIQLEWLKLLQFDFYSRKFVYVCDPSQIRRGPTGTDRRPLSVTTGDYVAGKSAGYENQVLPLIRRIFSRSITFCLKHDIRLHVMKINGAKQNGLIGSSYWVVRCVEHSLHTRVFYVLRLNFLDHWKKVCKGDR